MTGPVNADEASADRVELRSAVREYAANELPLRPSYFELVDFWTPIFMTRALTLSLDIAHVGIGPLAPDGSPPLELLGEPFAGGRSDASLILVQKGRLRRRQGPITLDVGDFHASFGRGMALNIVKSDSLDLDTTILGLRTRMGYDWFDFEFGVGRVHPRIISLSFANRGLERTPDDFLESARFRFRPFQGTDVSAWGTLFSFEPRRLEGTIGRQLSAFDDAAIGGGALSTTGTFMEIYIEADRIFYWDDSYFSDTDPNGRLIYASLATYFGPWTSLFEVKRYKNAEAINIRLGSGGYEFITPPTLELAEAVTRDSAETINSPDILGFRLRVDRRIEPARSVFSLTGAWFYDFEPLPPTPARETIGHVYADWEYISDRGAHALLNLGYRRDVRSVRSDGVNETTHASMDLESSRIRGRSVNLFMAYRSFRDTGLAEPFSFRELDVTAGFHLLHDLALLWSLQYTDDPVVLNNPLLGARVGNVAEELFGALTVEWTPSSGRALTLFYGARRAGLQCGGGQCRFLPAFDGLELTAYLIF